MFTIEFLQQFKYNSAHFYAHEDWRETLHGHNYKVTLVVKSFNIDRNTQDIVNVEELKKITNDICDSLKHKLILGRQNDNCVFEDLGESIRFTLKCDGKVYLSLSFTKLPK